MTRETYYFLPEDIAVLERMVAELHVQIKELGKEQGEAARQSTENFGHDDACQESVHHARTIVLARLGELQRVVNSARIVQPEKGLDSVRLGALVRLSDGRSYRIGSYMVFAEHFVRTISYNSPLGRALLGRSRGDEVEFQGKRFVIEEIS